jgi:hypothetical protein
MTYRTQGSLLGCGCGMNGLGEVAGSVSGLDSLEQDIRLMSAEMRRVFGNFRYDQRAFDRLLQRGRDGNLTEMTRDERKQFVAGIVGKCAKAAATIKQLGAKNVTDPAERQRNVEAQAGLLRSARSLWTSAFDMLRTARPIGAASGLGLDPITISIIVGAAVVAVVAAYGITVWGDLERVDRAQEYADRACSGCSPEQRAQFIRTLTGGGAIGEAAGAIAKELAPYIGLGVGAAILIGGGFAYFKYRQGRQGRQLRRVLGF